MVVYKTAADWAATNPVLVKYDIGIDTTNNQYRVGDGVTPFLGLVSASVTPFPPNLITEVLAVSIGVSLSQDGHVVFLGADKGNPTLVPTGMVTLFPAYLAPYPN